ncbi:helicase [bacterium]|nr:helicase [bacterium]
MKTSNKKARDKFQERIKKGLLGPGSDIFGLPDEEEIIADYPLQRYFTGILFPEKESVSSQSEMDDAQGEAETTGEEEEVDAETNRLEDNSSSTEELQSVSTANEDNEDDSLPKRYISANQYFPTNMGLTFCIENKVKEIEVEFNFGMYYQPKPREVKIVMPEKGYRTLIEDQSFPFKEILAYEDGFMWLTRGIKGSARTPRTEEYAALDKYKEEGRKKDDPAREYIYYLDRLIGRTWKRKQVSKRLTIPLGDSQEPKVFHEEKTKAGYWIKTYEHQGNRYAKILLTNLSKRHSQHKFSNKNEELNQKCLFQTSIKVFSDQIKAFQSYHELNPFDEEARRLNFLYRDVHSYGIGHGCGVIWNQDEKGLETTFLPQHDALDTKNTLEEKYLKESLRLETEQIRKIERALDIYDLSIFSPLTKDQILLNLQEFVTAYDRWIKTQKEMNNTIAGQQEREIGSGLIGILEENLNRLSESLDILKDEKVFQCFQFANTAMLIQLIISNDPGFGKEEKYLSEFNSEIDYNSIEFFRNYDFARLPFGRPAYRPFQLAFVLLNLKGIIDENSKERNEIVDLLWFPTGGGKTEAYLAVTAFTILWRRMSYNKGYEGTSVIMRYTLRLLTSQQFERASRLVVALEFLRRTYLELLKEEPITIGMWVGMASTPNKIDDAKKIIGEIGQECDKGKKGDPEAKNVFQISSCPWCGARLVNKREGDSMFHSFRVGGNSIVIYCPNENCCFNDRIPVQVVDELLYKDPPTLLFATVDKFAMLAWREEGHKFFNSLSDGLPPDLIIQDELHLLSGPLGSITGIYESIIELLSTKDNRKPKIIASTATTRNTDFQIRQLYGKTRSVNVFPPPGLSYKDSFFARESKEKSKRKFMGFMPTGKTALDTQLQILAHLLVARLEAYKAMPELANDYWTIVSYCNSLKEVGKIYNKVYDEIRLYTLQLQSRLFKDDPSLQFNYQGLPRRTRELTSRVKSSKIKAILNELEEKFSDEKIFTSDKGYRSLNKVVDLVLATNMISVGIDVSRLNVMLINGQPRNVAEYIQSSSRVARQTEGLVVTLLDPNRARDKSYFEHFQSFHQAFYKSIEPLSLTPFTENTIEKMLSSMLITYVRHKLGLNGKKDAHRFNQVSPQLEELKQFIRQRVDSSSGNYAFLEEKLNELITDWRSKIKTAEETETILTYDLRQSNKHGKYTPLMKRPNEDVGEKDEAFEDWVVMQSMREVDTSTFIQIRPTYTGGTAYGRQR